MQLLVRAARRWLAVVCALGLVVVVVVSAAVPVAAQSVPGANGWSPGAGAAGDNTFNGFVDQPAAGASIAAGSQIHVSGWIVDTSAEGWAGIDDVQVLNGSTLLGHATVAINRPDVAAATGNSYWAAAGFDGVVSSGGLPSGPISLTIAAHTPGKGTWVKQVGVTITGGNGSVITNASTGLVLTIVSPTSTDEILANDNGTIFGTAFDTRTRAELGVGVDRVQVYLDGPRGVPGSQPLGTGVQDGSNWSVGWQPTQYDHVKHHILFVYAHSNVTGEERLLNQEITID